MNYLRKHFSAILALSLIITIGLGCNFKSDEDWKKELHGKKLSMAKNSGSISDRVDFWFCNTGEYAKRTQFSGLSGGFSMADEDYELGNWTINQGTLTLKSQDGKTSQYSITQGLDTNVIQLDGNGYLVETHNECQ